MEFHICFDLVRCASLINCLQSCIPNMEPAEMPSNQTQNTMEVQLNYQPSKGSNFWLKNHFLRPSPLCTPPDISWVLPRKEEMSTACEANGRGNEPKHTQKRLNKGGELKKSITFRDLSWANPLASQQPEVFLFGMHHFAPATLFPKKQKVPTIKSTEFKKKSQQKSLNQRKTLHNPLQQSHEVSVSSFFLSTSSPQRSPGLAGLTLLQKPSTSANTSVPSSASSIFGKRTVAKRFWGMGWFFGGMGKSLWGYISSFWEGGD